MAKYAFDTHKLIYHMDRVYAHYRDGKRIYPLHIDMGATKRCNAACVYCYGLHQKKTDEIIPREALVRLFEDAPGLGIRSITLTGDGEPTMNPAVYEAIEAGKKRGLDIGFATNGINLTVNQIFTLLNCCTWLRFNISAGSPGAYYRIHGVKRWQRVTDNIALTTQIKRQYGYHCTIGLQMVLIPEALDEVYPVANIALNTRADYFVIKQYSNPGCQEMPSFPADWYDTKEVKDVLRAAEAMSTEQTKIIAKWQAISGKGKRQYDHCVDCPLIFQISGNGRAYPCGYLFNDERYCYGDLNNETLQEILDSDRYWAIIQNMRENFDVHKDCIGCCRHDAMNKFIWDYLHPPDHLNFI